MPTADVIDIATRRRLPPNYHARKLLEEEANKRFLKIKKELERVLGQLFREGYDVECGIFVIPHPKQGSAIVCLNAHQSHLVTCNHLLLAAEKLAEIADE